MAGITVKIGGNDVTQYIDARTLSIRDELTSKVNSASFDFICNDITVVPLPGEVVLIEEGANKLFSGRILSKKESFLPPNLLKYPVECIDHTRDLDKRLVAESYKDEKAGDIIKDIIAKYTQFWVSPTGHDDPDEKWSNETNAYDGNTTTKTDAIVNEISWSSFLELTISPILCSKVRFNAKYDSDYSNLIDLDVYYGDDWHHVYQGVYPHNTWVEKSLGGNYNVTKARINIYNGITGYIYSAQLFEFDFYSGLIAFTTTNVSDGPTISEISFDYVQVSEAITKIAEICGYEWYVDYDKDIHFFAKNTYPAPFQLDDNQANYKDLIINTDVSQLRNRVFVKSSGYKEPYFSDVFIGDGIASSWTCTYKYIAKDCPSKKLPDPTDLPGAKGCNVTFSPDDTYLVIGFDASPYMMIYKRDNDTFTKLDNPVDMPTGTVWDASFSSDGIYLAVVFPQSPYLIIYKRSGDTFTKIANPDIMPGNNAWGVDFSSDDVYLAIAHDILPRITIYKRSGDTFTKLNDPAVKPSETGWCVSFSPDTVYLALGYRYQTGVNPRHSYIMVYKRDGDTFTALGNSDSFLPALPNDCYNVSWSSDGIYLAAAHDDLPYITIYIRNGDTFTKLPELSKLPTGNGADVTFSSDGVFLTITHTNYPFMSVYKHIKNDFIKIDDPEILPTGNGTSANFSSNLSHLAIAHDIEPYITIYKQHAPFVTLNGVNQTVGWDGLDNPADFDFMFNYSTKILSRGSCVPPIEDGDEIIISYGITKSAMLRRDDQDSIDIIKATEGGDGIFEFCIVDNNIDSIAWANEAAKADLLKNADPTIMATFITNRSDIKTGQIITLISTKRNINQQFIVQSVELTRVDVVTEYPSIPYKPADEAVIGYKPASEAEKGYRLAGDSGGFIYYIFNVTIANKFRKLEDLFLYLLTRTDESL
ncbi:hypothetical protein ES705_14590 [subsurface metagenome]